MTLLVHLLSWEPIKQCKHHFIPKCVPSKSFKITNRNTALGTHVLHANLIFAYSNKEHQLWFYNIWFLYQWNDKTCNRSVIAGWARLWLCVQTEGKEERRISPLQYCRADNKTRTRGSFYWHKHCLLFWGIIAASAATVWSEDKVPCHLMIKCEDGVTVTVTHTHTLQ